MSAVSNIYLIIFLPLIASLFSKIFDKKSLPFSIAIFSFFTVFLLLIRVFPAVLFYKKINSDFQLSPISISLEFSLDLLGIIFLILTTLSQIIILFFCCNEIAIKKRTSFYPVYLLQFFSLIGVFTTNNIFNLFIFLELCGFCSFAILSMKSDERFSKISFKYFCFNAAASLLILFCFFTIYLTSGEINFDKNAFGLKLLDQQNQWFSVVIFFILCFSFIIKFFPFWLYFEKSSANSLGIDLFFVRSVLGIFLIFKFLYFFFYPDLFFGETSFFGEKVNFKIILISLSLFLTIYSAGKLYQQKHLKTISAYFCINNVGFIISCLALQTTNSIRASFFFLFNIVLINLFLFFLATFIRRHFPTTLIKNIWLIKKKYFWLFLPIVLMLISITALPLTPVFFANFYLVHASLNVGFELFLIVAMIVSDLAYVILALRLLVVLFFKESLQNEVISLNKNEYNFYLLSFWFLTFVIYFVIIKSNFLNQLSLKFADYLLGAI